MGYVPDEYDLSDVRFEIWLCPDYQDTVEEIDRQTSRAIPRFEAITTKGDGSLSKALFKNEHSISSI